MCQQLWTNTHTHTHTHTHTQSLFLSSYRFLSVHIHAWNKMCGLRCAQVTSALARTHPCVCVCVCVSRHVPLSAALLSPPKLFASPSSAARVTGSSEDTRLMDSVREEPWDRAPCEE